MKRRETNKGMTRSTLFFEDELLHGIRRVGFNEERSLSDVVNVAVKEYLIKKGVIQDEFVRK